jgi:hypothetical protein
MKQSYISGIVCWKSRVSVILTNVMTIEWISKVFFLMHTYVHTYTHTYIHTYIYIHTFVYSVYQEKSAILRVNLPQVNLLVRRCNPIYLYPTLYGYGDTVERKYLVFLRLHLSYQFNKLYYSYTAQFRPSIAKPRHTEESSRIKLFLWKYYELFWLN